MTHPRRWHLAVLAALCLPTPADAQSRSRWRVEDRAVVGDFGVVLALAAGQDHLYVFTQSAVGVYDARLERWSLPRPLPPGMFVPPGSPAIVDPVDRSVWIGTTMGLLHYDPRLETSDVIQVPGGVVDLLFDRDDTFRGVYVRSRSGWLLVERGSGMLVQAGSLPPPGSRFGTVGLDEFLRREPGLIARAPLLLTDDRLRDYRYTAAAELRQTEELFVGTDGIGVYRVDALTREIQHLPFGLLDDGVWAVAVVGDDVVAGSSGTGRRWGFTILSRDLQRFAYEEGPPSTGYRFRRVYGIVDGDDGLLAATDRGGWRVDREGRATRVTGGALPEGVPAYAVARTAHGTWFGTDRGLVKVEDDNTGSVVDARVRDPILALLGVRDTLWIGGAHGVAFLPPDGADLLVPLALAEEPWMRDPVVALGQAGDVLVAATEDRVAWRDAEGRWQVERSLAGELGRIAAVAPASDGVWIGGRSGIVYFRPGRAAFPLAVPADELPAPVRSMASDDRYLWVATERGLVRFDQSALPR